MLFGSIVRSDYYQVCVTMHYSALYTVIVLPSRLHRRSFILFREKASSHLLGARKKGDLL